VRTDDYPHSTAAFMTPSPDPDNGKVRGTWPLARDQLSIRLLTQPLRERVSARWQF